VLVENTKQSSGSKVASFLLSGSWLSWFISNDTHGNLLSVVSLFLLGSSLDTSGFLLLGKLVLSDLLLLHLVDGFNKNELVLIKVTLSMQVEEMVDILSDLLGFSVLLEKSSKDSLSSHPEDLRGHSCVFGTSSLTMSLMSSLSFGFMHSLASRS